MSKLNLRLACRVNGGSCCHFGQSPRGVASGPRLPPPPPKPGGPQIVHQGRLPCLDALLFLLLPVLCSCCDSFLAFRCRRRRRPYGHPCGSCFRSTSGWCRCRARFPGCRGRRHPPRWGKPGHLRCRCRRCRCRRSRGDPSCCCRACCGAYNCSSCGVSCACSTCGAYGGASCASSSCRRLGHPRCRTRCRCCCCRRNGRSFSFWTSCPARAKGED